jgi:hypothetical protein
LPSQRRLQFLRVALHAARDRAAFRVPHTEAAITVSDDIAVRQLLADVGAVVSTPEDEGMVFDVDLAPTPFAPGSRLDLISRRLLRAAAREPPVFSARAAFRVQRLQSNRYRWKTGSFASNANR